MSAASFIFPAYLIISVKKLIERIQSIRKNKTSSYIVATVFEVIAFIYLSFPMLVLIFFVILSKEAYDMLLERLDLMGAMFSIFTWGSIMAKNVSEYFDKKEA